MSIVFKTANTIPELHIAFNIVKPISNLYPDFSNWYWDKVVPGIILGDDKVIIAENNGNIIGVSMIKDGNEKKIRAIRVNEKYQKKGYGLHLIDYSLKLLNESKPIASVADEMINEYSRMFINRYDFDMTHVYNGLYRKNHLEYEFNGNKKLNEKTINF